ncbi:MAG: NTP transferase domain-containing protein, partial [Solobacterium sp.]|nr:NTP transferase domain-containing protein [Lachnospiraceae bacterium]MBR4164464.1 NTP transferase domain-containing protein [Solobacterium sp.]
MNKQDADVLNILSDNETVTQRDIAEMTGHSLGIVNRSIANLRAEGLVNDKLRCTKKARTIEAEHAPQNAIILAAGFGMRMVPINREVSKAFLEVKGELLIERLIRQLHEAGIRDITIVIGFLKEQFEYLIDEFDVNLVVNPDYATCNNLHSLQLVSDKIRNTYILPCDIWCRVNPFRKRELYSWYAVSRKEDPSSDVRVNRKLELVKRGSKETGNEMIGIAYLTGKITDKLLNNLHHYAKDPAYDDAFWEEALYENDRMIAESRIFDEDEVIMIDTFEQLREFDSDSNHLKSDAIQIAANALHAQPEDIIDIQVLKKGMTNRSFLFRCFGKQYIMRIPGEGTDQLINRKEEAAVYQVILDKDICDRIIYINPENGYKITEYIDRANVCDPFDPKQVKKCMKRLRGFHDMKLQVNHTFDIFRLISFYESLWGDAPSMYRDYKATKEKVLSLQSYIDQHKKPFVLTHIDAVPDNFLIYLDENDEEKIRLIDWEYAGMQDSDVDIAMFGIYSLYNKEQMDALIDTYYEEGCDPLVRIKIYCYVAACGLLWSNWCEYKKTMGIEFGEYSLRQYRYAKDYYKYAMCEIEKRKEV